MVCFHEMTSPVGVISASTTDESEAVRYLRSEGEKGTSFQDEDVCNTFHRTQLQYDRMWGRMLWYGKYIVLCTFN